MSNNNLPDKVFQTWEKLLEVNKKRCHLHFDLEGGSILNHVDVSMKSANNTVNRIVNDLPNQFKPRRILEIGASVGFNSIALAEYYSYAEVFSVEPDKEAVGVAEAMANHLSINYKPIVGVGEKLNFPNGYFDLIVCHTVIEHVNDVSEMIREMARVLSPGGYIHLDAPNYMWPYEPHLAIWCLPMLGKQLVRVFAVIQGKRKELWYIEHLKFVTPYYLERQYKDNGLKWENRVVSKLLNSIEGDAQIVRYRKTAKVVKSLGKIAFIQNILLLIIRLGLYPSVMYTVKK